MAQTRKAGRKYTRKAKPARKSSKKPATKQGLIRLVKKVALSNSEPKMASQLFSSLTDPGHQTLSHNVTYYQGNLLKTLQGETSNPGTNVQDNRIGNEIYATGLKLRMQLINAVTQSNVTYKIFVFRYQSGKTLADTGFWCGPNGAGGTQNRMIDFVDTREITVLKTITVRTASQTANMNQTQAGVGQEGRLQERMHSTYRDIWIPLNRKIRYDDNNSPVPKFTDIGMACVAYDVNNTNQSTVLGYLDFTSRLYFRDP